MTDSSVLCVDIGTNSIKAVLVDGEGKICPKFLNVPVAILFSKCQYYGVKAKTMHALQQEYNKTDVYIKEVFPLLDNVCTYNQTNCQYYPFEITNTISAKIKVTDTESYYPEEVIAMLLEDITNSLPSHNIQDIKVSLTNSETAGCIAGITGLNLLEPIVESTAIFHAFLERRIEDLDKPLLVFDFGVNGLKLHRFNDAISSNSCTEKFEKFSAKELTTLLFNYVLKLENLYNASQSERNKIEEECEIAKISLSFDEEYKLQWKYKNVVKSAVITRSQFEGCIEQSLKRLVKFAKSVCSPNEEAVVVLVGGSSRIPAIRTRLKQVFPNILEFDIEPEFAIAYGLAVHTTTTQRKYLF